MYRCRWQIELVSERAKSLGAALAAQRFRALRVQVELWAKLLGMVVMHWAVLLSGTCLETQATRIPNAGARKLYAVT
ncbi:unnamed protein product [Gemmata massiliana]|uniref:Transposase DDE domain-containing protein n=1 Tax=Gemmata massiliana TaxID=1210884 RepID=A0A6P2D5C6_9BACT|nr:unnamed protein product [Gemmata massiliana]